MGEGRLLKNPGCEAVTICGGKPGLFFLANDADRGELRLRNAIGLLVLETEMRFGSDRPAFPQVPAMRPCLS
jgi:hypothetical protein